MNTTFANSSNSASSFLGTYGRSYFENPNSPLRGDEYKWFVEVSPVNDPSYLTVYTWEHFELTRWRLWMGRNWAWSLYASAIYVLAIFSVQRLMKNRQPFQLRGALTCWNLMLAAFSIMGFLRTAPELFHVLKNESGFYKSICVREEHNAATAFWGWLMALSKMVELGDTAFIVLRKQPLIFLHWYHHITVLAYTWYTYEAYEPPLRYFMTMNMFVHALMYSYYALKSLKVQIPRNWAMMITFLQISQMVVGVTINIYSLYVKAMNVPCTLGWENMNIALTMYASYFVLFANFFHRSYMKAKLA
ncbi:elongation of very long chain fatty acids protein 6 [Folsomia candida]|uniref:elongation of very long chain fatty acids protein 6 n=1 Tax=Folsomia candida TaxID=158441 RepID=UPI000B90823B|nr:elongation of very long chain fatty acids protein 6 [Folsomia candida]